MSLMIVIPWEQRDQAQVEAICSFIDRKARTMRVATRMTTISIISSRVAVKREKKKNMIISPNQRSIPKKGRSNELNRLETIN